MKTQPAKGEFCMTINGIERTGKMTMDSICQLEQDLGFSMLYAMQNPGKCWGFNTIATVIAVGLAAKNPKITKAHVTHWIGLHLEAGGTIDGFIAASQQAVFTALGQQVRVGEALKKAQAGELEEVDAADGQEGAQESAPLEDVDAPATSLRSA